MAEPIDVQEFERFRPYLLVLARMHFDRRLQAKFDPSDLVQQTMLQAHRAAGQFEGQTDGERAAWLRQILARTLLHEVRDYARDKRSVERERSLEANLTAASGRLECWFALDQTGPVDRAARNEQFLRLADALEGLPEDQRDAIILHYLQGWKLAEIAEQLDRSVSAVGGLLHRGLKRLREVVVE